MSAEELRRERGMSKRVGVGERYKGDGKRVGDTGGERVGESGRR